MKVTPESITTPSRWIEVLPISRSAEEAALLPGPYSPKLPLELLQQVEGISIRISQIYPQHYWQAGPLLMAVDDVGYFNFRSNGGRLFLGLAGEGEEKEE